ncbi:hypothetical protein [Flavobacterium humi]|uniref:hypothetical protein n=1 Tax=Flavobacterium humi TaxID=2562683 RepID=UPI00146B9328|nr:hypothetical protein [Flavobacterium humi]
MIISSATGIIYLKNKSGTQPKLLIINAGKAKMETWKSFVFKGSKPKNPKKE